MEVAVYKNISSSEVLILYLFIYIIQKNYITWKNIVTKSRVFFILFLSSKFYVERFHLFIAKLKVNCFRFVKEEQD
jgi:hypothetical protein